MEWGINLKTKVKVRPIRYRLTSSFIIFAAALMVLLLLMQGFVYGSYRILSAVGFGRDLYFYVGAQNGQVYISSIDDYGRQIIFRVQLITTIISMILAVITARIISKRLSRPITKMSDQAKEMGAGNYDIVFDGGHQYQEVDQLATTLTEAAAELKKSDSLQKDLLANVSHDLRTPLTMIKSYAEMIRDLSGDDPAKRDEHLSVIIDETDRLSELVNDVLVLSKMQAGVTEMEMETFDLQKAAESVLSTYMVMEQEGYSIHYIPAYPGESLNIMGDERRIKQVISNLLSNAIRYSVDVKDITLGISTHIGNVRLYVSDKGPGISDAEKEKIWHRYEKASSRGQRSQGNGTGLGLSIAAEILDKHHATYGVDSVLGEGSTFWFELPIA